jgi:hypothetical protein
MRLLESGARVRWFSQDVDVAEEIWLSGRPDRLEIAFREPRVDEVEEAAAVIATLGGSSAQRLSAQARALNRPVSVIGRPELSTFDLDDSDDGDDSGDPQPCHAQPWHRPLSAPIRRAREWLSARVAESMTVLAALPVSFGH